ncbi:MAG: EAL domain-containing protein, partial [Chloroflexi bacterium]
AVLLRHVQDLAERDSLTGAANRRMFQEALTRTLSAARKGSSRVTAVLFLDLDDFKVVNDSLGHAAGDALLVAVTERISGLVREGDLVARLGGDEFAILTSDSSDLHRSRAMAERLVRELRAPYLIRDEQVAVTASIGIASVRGAEQSAEEVIRNADVAMYMAKANGKARFAIFDPGMHAAIRERHELGAQLQRAVELDQLRLVYQPIVELGSARLAGLEALVRWEHPDRGLITPGEFIEIAEENGAILPIGQWVLREACQRAGNWQREGLTPKGIFLCVNVSAREVQQPDFVTSVRTTLEHAGVEPSTLMLEITETALLKASGPTMDTLSELRALGVRVVIDDFGTGYFSLSHLRLFPVDALKIATEFVQGSSSDARSAALAGAIVALSQSLDIATVDAGLHSLRPAHGAGPDRQGRRQPRVSLAPAAPSLRSRLNCRSRRVHPHLSHSNTDPTPHARRPDRGLTPRGRVISPVSAGGSPPSGRYRADDLDLASIPEDDQVVERPATGHGAGSPVVRRIDRP